MTRYLPLGLVVGVLLCAPAPAAAQAMTSTPMASDSFLALIPPRDPAEINQEITAAQRAGASAQEAEKRGQALRSGADARIQAKKREISSVDARRKLAEKSKQDAEATALQAEKRALELEKNLLERRKSLREAEIDLAKHRRELADLSRRALELERQLGLKRGELAGTGSGGPESARSSRVLFDLERATLEAQRRRSDKERDVNAREKRVIERRLQILDAQRSVVGGG